MAFPKHEFGLDVEALVGALRHRDLPLPAGVDPGMP